MKKHILGFVAGIGLIMPAQAKMESFKEIPGIIAIAGVGLMAYSLYDMTRIMFFDDPSAELHNDLKGKYQEYLDKYEPNINYLERQARIFYFEVNDAYRQCVIPLIIACIGGGLIDFGVLLDKHRSGLNV